MEENLFSSSNYLIDEIRNVTRKFLKGHSADMLFQRLRLRGLGGDTLLLPGKIQNEQAVECFSLKSTCLNRGAESRPGGGH